MNNCPQLQKTRGESGQRKSVVNKNHKIRVSEFNYIGNCSRCWWSNEHRNVESREQKKYSKLILIPQTKLSDKLDFNGENLLFFIFNRY